MHKKTKKGKTYWYIRECSRVNSKPTITNQVYLGTPERILEMVQGSRSQVKQIQVQEFGSLWLANLIDRQIGLVEIIDELVPRAKNEKGPSVGEYFLYAAINRMIDPRSKLALPDWYETTAVQQVRPVQVRELGSERYWEKWNRVSREQLEEIARKLGQRVAELAGVQSHCFFFDTTNYYTFMASPTESDLAQRGKNKAGRHWLRQVGLALLVSRDADMPIFYREYEGNRHDSKVLARLMSELFSAMEQALGPDKDLTIVLDKGMNSADNFAAIDAHARAHFITTYSLHCAKEYLKVKDSQFEPVDTPKNRRLLSENHEQDLISAWRTTAEFWGKKRTVVLTYNPRTAAKQRYSFDEKLFDLQDDLFEMRKKLREALPQWRKPTDIRRRYEKACAQLHIPNDLYDLHFEQDDGGWKMTFRKNHYRIGQHIKGFGKNLLITDHVHWSTTRIVEASLDRYRVEQDFRQTKDFRLVSLEPIRHWTDSKIRCHILSCFVALAYARLIELRLEKAALKMTARTAIDKMRTLHSCLVWHTGTRKPGRILEQPTETQAAILAAFDHRINSEGVLQPISK
jgi:transposase